MSAEFKIKFTDIPLGSWDHMGNWWPNLNLKMPVSEQRRHNMIGGHYDRPFNNPDDFHCVFVASEPEPTLIDKIKAWFNV